LTVGKLCFCEARIICEIIIPSAQFCCELTTTLKIISIFKEGGAKIYPLHFLLKGKTLFVFKLLSLTVNWVSCGDIEFAIITEYIILKSNNSNLIKC
jgi:hypothetical protein